MRSQHHPEVLGTLSDEDFHSLGEILPQAFNSILIEDLAEFIPKAIAADSADVLVSRDMEGKIVSVMVVNVDYGAGKLRGRIDDVATHEDHKEQGHAGAVLDYALDWFRLRGIRRIALTSNDDRQPAHRLYESRGFKIHDTNQFQLDLY